MPSSLILGWLVILPYSLKKLYRSSDVRTPGVCMDTLMVFEEVGLADDGRVEETMSVGGCV